MRTVLRSRDLEIELEMSSDVGSPGRQLALHDELELRGVLSEYLLDPANRCLARGLLRAMLLIDGDRALPPLDEVEVREALLQRIHCGRVLISRPRPRPLYLALSGGSPRGALDEALVEEEAATAGAGAASSGQEKPVRSDICRVDGFTLSGAERKEGYRFRIPGDVKAPGGKARYQIIGGAKKGGTVTVQTEIGAGPCEKHKNKLISISHSDTKLGDAGGDFSLPCHSDYGLDQKLRQLIWPYPAKTRETRVRLSACDSLRPSEATVEVFPDLQWEASIKAGYSTTIERKAGKRRKTKAEGKFGVEGEISVESEETSKGVSVSFEREINTALDTLNTAKTMVEHVAEAIDYIGGVELEFTWPTFVLEGSWGYEEQDDGPLVEYKYDVGVGFSPLFGVMGRVDILEVLCQLVPALGAFIAKVKRRIAKGVGNETLGAKGVLACWLSADATIGGMLHFVGSDMKPKPVEGKVEGEIELKIQPEVSVELHLIIIDFEAGIEGYAKTVLTGSLTGVFEQQVLCVEGEFVWSGLTLGWRMYCNFAAGSTIKKEVIKGEDALEVEVEKGKEYKILDGKTFAFAKRPILPKR